MVSRATDTGLRALASSSESVAAKSAKAVKVAGK
jgi:hypothetical protein